MKIPKVTKLPSGKYFVRLRLGGTEYAKTFPTQKDAEAWALATKAQYKAGQLRQRLPDEEKTIYQLLQETVDGNDYTPATKKIYRLAGDHFAQFMHKPYSSIANWQKVVTTECKKVSPNSVAVYWSKICSALRFHGLSVPQVKIPTTPPKGKNWLTPDQVKTFEQAIHGNKYEVLFLFMLSSMRASEALGVTKADILPEGIHVRGTKTPGSDRIVPFINERVEYLAKQDLPKCCYTTLKDQLAKVCKESDLPILSPHGLRYTYASQCYHAGVPERITMKIGGWSSLQVMHETYIQIADADIQKYSEALKGVF